MFTENITVTPPIKLSFTLISFNYLLKDSMPPLGIYYKLLAYSFLGILIYNSKNIAVKYLYFYYV